MKKPKFMLSRVSGMRVDDADLLDDLQRVAQSLGDETVSQKKYGEHGTYDCSTLIRRFGSWNKALRAAGLSLSNRINISQESLFENLLNLWQHYGRQPRRAELAFPPSTISQTPYNRLFGSWTDALRAFIDYANASDVESPLINKFSIASKQKVTGRFPSLRLRWQVLKRDRFTCCACGASPTLKPGTELQVDHVKPWSKDGKTILENLRTLCAECNRGKSNEHDV